MPAQLYECAKCGDVWRVAMVEQIDLEHDEVWSEPCCETCGAAVSPKMHDGKPLWHPLTDEEMDEDMHNA